MSISPADFLASAKQSMLNVDQLGEVAIRNAISRAYYAAFHQAQSVFPVDRAFFANASTGMHEAYIDQLMQAATGSSERCTAVKLKSLKGRRANADYRLGDDMPAYHAAMQVSAAESVFALLNDLTEPPPGANEAPASAIAAGSTCDDAPPPPTRRPKLQRIR